MQVSVVRIIEKMVEKVLQQTVAVPVEIRVPVDKVVEVPVPVDRVVEVSVPERLSAPKCETKTNAKTATAIHERFIFHFKTIQEIAFHK